VTLKVVPLGRKRERAAAPQANISSNSQLEQLLVDSLVDYAVFGVSPVGTIMSWNAGAERTFGYTRDEAIGSAFTMIFTEQDIKIGAPHMELSQAFSGECTQHDRWHVRKDRSRFWGTNTVQPIVDVVGAFVGYAKLIRDTTTSYVAYQQLHDSEQRHRLLVDSVEHFAIFALEIDGTVESWPTAAELVFGYKPAEIIGKSVASLFAASNGSTESYATFLEEASLCGSSNINTWFERKNGSHFLGAGKISELHSEPGSDFRGYVQIIHDITESDAAEQELRRRAQCDELTALPNRRTFFEFVVRAIALAKRKSTFQYAVLFIDLDHFKAVNDKYGHTIADELLIATGRRLERCLRSEDIAARIGGDEFAVLLNGISSVREADDAAERIAVAMQETIVVDGLEIGATVSVGIAIGSAHCERPEDILRDADIAMYAAKRAGRARAIRFNADSNQPSFAEPDDLGSAIANGEMRIAFQPVIQLKSNVLFGYEALIRWQHPQRGLLQPQDFIPAAEGSEHIFAIDLYMIEHSLRQLRDWQDEKLARTVQMSVNISSRELSHMGFFEQLNALVLESGVPANRLRLEITESATMERSAAARAMISAIRALGVSVDIDDFGTGYSSLQALQHVDVDALKIDASFVATIGSLATVLLDAVVGLAHDLGTVAIAEGIETAEQLAYLISVDCDLGQGFLFSPPLDAPGALEYALR
jgi:diguanylate cyclase (GGDEF)-like protein/PAS domain S-box-containing protein